MAGSKILVLGGTGPLGICILRELLHRNHATIAYARNPSKIPEDLASDPLLEVIKGELDDKDALSTAISQASTIISVFGPVLSTSPPSETLYADCYSLVLTLMRRHSVRRIFALSTISVTRPEDSFSLLRSVMVSAVRIFFNKAYQNVVNVGKVFERDGEGVEWTVFRVAMIPGGADTESWKKDREDGETFVGWVGQKGWSASQRRGAVARWLADAVESGAAEWVGKMPAVSRRSGSSS